LLQGKHSYKWSTSYDTTVYFRKYNSFIVKALTLSAIEPHVSLLEGLVIETTLNLEAYVM